MTFKKSLVLRVTLRRPGQGLEVVGREVEPRHGLERMARAHAPGRRNPTALACPKSRKGSGGAAREEEEDDPRRDPEITANRTTALP
mmetsp:Transcript_29793/g.71987  ORF Transcript_29793/g.71987 Transcript_29793/m.71987 type:complete len:87 (-) Transcript_29793:951-1211(-)